MNIYLSTEEKFDNNGLGFLIDCLSANVVEELNGEYGLNVTYPINSSLSDYLVAGNIIKADVGDNNYQLFRISQVEKDFKIISLYARHIYYDLLDNFIEDSAPTNLDCASAAKWLLDRAEIKTKFEVYSDAIGIHSARYVRRNPVECFMGNIDNSLVNLYNVEIERDNYLIKFFKQRGNNKNVKLIIGKNIKDINVNIDISSLFTKIMPLGYDGLMLPEKYIESPLINNYPTPKIGKYEFSNIKYDPEDEEAYHTLEEAYQALRNETNLLFLAGIDKPVINIKIDWLELSKTKEYYEKYNFLEKVSLGDTITAEILGLNFETRVIKTTYNVVTKQIDKFEIGTFKPTFQNTVNTIVKNVEEINPSTILEQAKDNATKLLTSAMGGYVYKTHNELFIMDTDNPNTATKVWRWNLNGLGYSKNGINGPYEIAITQDGSINADFITSGKINTSLIEGYEQLILTVTELNNQYEQNVVTKKKATGYPLVVEDAGPYNIESLKVYGNSEQDTTETSPSPDEPSEIRNVEPVENLWDYGTLDEYFYSGTNGTKIYPSETNPKYVDIELAENKISFSNYRSTGYPWVSKFIKLEKNTNYYLSSVSGSPYKILGFNSNEDGSDGTQICYDNGTGSLNKNITFNSGNYEYYAISIFPDSSGENNYIENLMISKSNNSYVPYGHWLKGKATGRNLLKIDDVSTSDQGVNLSVKNGVITLSGQTTDGVIFRNDIRNYNNIKELNKSNLINKTLTLSYEGDNISHFTITISTINNTNFLQLNENTKEVTKVITEDLNELFIYCEASFNGIFNIKLQLEESDTATECEPYKEKEFLYNMNKYDEEDNVIGYYELSKINDNKDDLDFISGILNKKIDKIVLTGNENWNIRTTDAGNQFINENDLLKLNGSRKLLCSSFINDININAWQALKENYIMVHPTNFTIFRIRYDSCTSVDEFKQFLKDQYNAGTPVTIYYVLETPEQIQLNPINVELFEGYNRITLEDKYGIVEEAEMTYLTDSKLNGQYASKVDLKLTADGISQNVDAQLKDVNGEIKDVKGSVDLKLNKKDLFSEFNVNVDQVKINSKNFKLDENGHVEANDLLLTGGKLDLIDDGTEENASIKITKKQEIFGYHLKEGMDLKDRYLIINPGLIGALPKNTNDKNITLLTLCNPSNENETADLTFNSGNRTIGSIIFNEYNFKIGNEQSYNTIFYFSISNGKLNLNGEENERLIMNFSDDWNSGKIKYTKIKSINKQSFYDLGISDFLDGASTTNSVVNNIFCLKNDNSDKYIDLNCYYNSYGMSIENIDNFNYTDEDYYLVQDIYNHYNLLTEPLPEQLARYDKDNNGILNREDSSKIALFQDDLYQDGLKIKININNSDFLTPINIYTENKRSQQWIGFQTSGTIWKSKDDIINRAYMSNNVGFNFTDRFGRISAGIINSDKGYMGIECSTTWNNPEGKTGRYAADEAETGTLTLRDTPTNSNHAVRLQDLNAAIDKLKRDNGLK